MKKYKIKFSGESIRQFGREFTDKDEANKILVKVANDYQGELLEIVNVSNNEMVACAYYDIELKRVKYLCYK